MRLEPTLPNSSAAVRMWHDKAVALPFRRKKEAPLVDDHTG